MAQSQELVTAFDWLTLSPYIGNIVASKLQGSFMRPQRVGKPSGWWAHVPFASWIVEASRPDVLVELGTHHGVSYAAFCEAVLRCELPTRCYAIDHWRGDPHAGAYGDEVFEDIRAFNEEHYGAFSELIRSEFDSAVAQFDDSSIDLLHIDGYHTFEAVQHDYETWRPKLSARAVVLLHDTNIHGNGFGVHRLFADLAARFPHFEFLHGYGLGVIGHGPQIPAVIRQLCASAGGNSAARIRNHFACLGMPWASLARAQEKHDSLRAQLETLAEHHREALASRDSAQSDVSTLTLRLETAQRERDEAVVAHQQSRLEVARADQLRETAQRERDEAVVAHQQSRLEAARADQLRETAQRERDEAVVAHQQSRLEAARADQLRETAQRERDEAVVAHQQSRLEAARADQLRETAQRERDEAVVAHQQSRLEAARADQLRVQLEEMRRSRDAARAELAARAERSNQVFSHQSRQLEEAERRLQGLDAERHALLSAHKQLVHQARLAAASVGRMVAALLQRHEDIVGVQTAIDPGREVKAWPVARPAERSRPRRLPFGLNWLRPVVRRGRARHHPVAQLVRRSLLFDARWYVATYADVAATGMDAAYHYAVFGGAEGRAPSPWFSTTEYLRQNPDVAQAGINALYHYEVQGRREGRPLASTLAALQTIEAESAPAAGTDAKQEFHQRSKAALDRFLHGNARLVLPVVAQPAVSIVLVLYEQAELTFRCLEALAQAIDVPVEVIVVDNASTDRTQALLDRVDGCLVLRQEENLHFLRGANIGARCARGQYVLFLNNDAMLKPGSLTAASQLCDDEAEVGAVGGKIVLLDGTLQEAGGIVWRDGSCLGYGRGRDPADAAFNFRRDVDYCSGAFLMVRRALFEQLGGFDPVFAPAYYEDTDLCMRLRAAGHRVVYEPRVELTHFEYGSARSAEAATKAMEANRKLFVQRHAAVLEASHQPGAAGDLLARMRPRHSGRVLVLDDCIPLPTLGGGTPRACRLLHCLHETGAFVTQFPLALPTFDPEQVRLFFPAELEFVAGKGRPDLSAFLRSRVGYYDTVVVSRPHNMDLFIRCCRDVPEFLESAAVVYDAEAIFAVREQARRQILGPGVATPDAASMSLATEMCLARAATIVLAVSESEAQSFRDAGCRDVRVLGHCLVPAPAGVGFEGRRDFLFVGRLEEEDSPNVDAVRWFVHEVMPRLDRLIGTAYALNVVGGCAPGLRGSLESPRVRFHGRVQDLECLYAGARICIAPTRFAAGIPHKVHEAASRGVPVVATSLIAGQLNWTHANELLSADEPEQFASACASAYQDRALWDRLQSRALEAVAKDCDPDRFKDTVRNILSDTRRGASPAAPVDDDSDTKARRRQTAQTWSVTPMEREQAEGIFWMAHPLVASRLNEKASGHTAHNGYDRLMLTLKSAGWSFPTGQAATLGCGFGALDRGLARMGFARSIVGYDLAEAAVVEARRQAAELGLDGIRYQIVDLEREELPQASFDLVFASHSVHHIAALDRLFASVRHALRPGGVFYLEDYVGPDRFQWTDAQLDAINEFLGSLPARYRRLPSGMMRDTVSRPSVEDVIAVDPSEAVCSSRIVEALGRHFRIQECHNLGGALLYMGLSGIAQNFDPNDPQDAAHLQRFFDMEDRLMAEGRIGSDFVTITAYTYSD